MSHPAKAPSDSSTTYPTDGASASEDGVAAKGPGLVVVFDGTRPVRQALRLHEDAGGLVDVGRETTRTLHISDVRVSRHHASVRRMDGAVQVMDHGSRNGTFVNGNRLVPGVWSAVAEDATLRFGRSLCLVAADVGLAAAPFDDHAPLWGSGVMHRIRRDIAAVARSDLHVLIRGGTGTGKELAARTIHDASGRVGPLVAVNCAALATGLLESELFGHTKGAFSGADQRRRGLVAQADGGTLFLDEIAELSGPAQASLLRFLDHGEVRSVGEDTTRRLEVRVVSATHRDLTAFVEAGRFRDDLLHRLAAYQVHLPLLDARREDIPELAARFAAARSCGLDPLAHEALLCARWSGSVRQLKASVEAACIRAHAAGRKEVDAADLPLLEKKRPDGVGVGAISAPLPEPTEARDPLEKGAIHAALLRHHGQVARVAKDLGCSRSGLYSAMERLGLDPASYRKRDP